MSGERHFVHTGNLAVVESDNLAHTSSGPLTAQPAQPLDIFVCTERVDEWRRSRDMIYRLFTDRNTRELNECVLGKTETHKTD